MGNLNRQTIRQLIVGSFVIASFLMVGSHIYRKTSYRLKKPEIIQQMSPLGPNTRRVSVRIGIKQDPYWKYPERITYYGDRETVYKRSDNGEWKEYRCVWASKGGYKQLETEQATSIPTDKIPGNPKNALEVLVDLDRNEEYAEADFEIKKKL